MQSLLKIYILLISLLFLAVSGCRQRGVDISSDESRPVQLKRRNNPGLLKEKIQLAGNSSKNKKETGSGNKNNTSGTTLNVLTDNVRIKEIKYVQQPSQDPMLPVTAYGTMMNERNTTIIQKPEEK